MKSNPVVPVVSVVAWGNDAKSNVGVDSTACVLAVKSNPVVPVVSVVVVCVVAVKSNPVVPVVSVVACGNEAKSNVGVDSTVCVVAVKSKPVVVSVVGVVSIADCIFKLVVW